MTKSLGHYWHEQRHVEPEHQPVILEGHTSKLCPSCWKIGKTSKRLRRRRINGPMHLSYCDETYPVRTARVSARQTWWNKGFIRWLIAPPEPADDNLWYECRTFAYCPRCRLEVEIKDLCYIRQFGRERRVRLAILGRFRMLQFFFDQIDLVRPII